MRCQDFERLMLEAKERESLREERMALEKHLEDCPACARFGALWEGLQKTGFGKTPRTELSAELSEKVRLRCRAEMDSLAHRPVTLKSERRPGAPPWPILAALLILTGLTVIFLIPAVEAFFKTQRVTVEAILVFVVVLQNAMMLLFAPVLLRRTAPLDFQTSE